MMLNKVEIIKDLAFMTDVMVEDEVAEITMEDGKKYSVRISRFNEDFDGCEGYGLDTFDFDFVTANNKHIGIYVTDVPEDRVEIRLRALFNLLAIDHCCKVKSVRVYETPIHISCL